MPLLSRALPLLALALALSACQPKKDPQTVATIGAEPKVSGDLVLWASPENSIKLLLPSKAHCKEGKVANGLPVMLCAAAGPDAIALVSFTLFAESAVAAPGSKEGLLAAASQQLGDVKVSQDLSVQPVLINGVSAMKATGANNNQVYQSVSFFNGALLVQAVVSPNPKSPNGLAKTRQIIESIEIPQQTPRPAAPAAEDSGSSASAAGANASKR